MKEISTQVVIVGSGSSGTSAGFDLYENKIPFIMLESGDQIGGAGKYGSNGVFAIDSYQQKAKGVKYGYKEAFEGLTSFNHYFVNGELISRFLKASGENIKRMERMGLHVTVERSEQKAHLNDPFVYHKFNSSKEKMANWEKIPKLFESAGNQVLRETTAVDLDYDQDGLKAVIAKDKNGQKIRIKAKKVIFADGGYCGNQEMMKKNFKEIDNILNLGERKATGTGIRIAEKLGAASLHNPILFAHSGAPSFDINPTKRDSSVETLSNLPLLWVDMTGHRFVNENIVYDSSMWGNACHNVGDKYYVIVDQATLDKFKKSKVELEDAFERQFCDVGETPRTDVGPIKNIQEDFDKGIEVGVVAKGDTIEELAEKLDMPANNLKQTLSEYNKAIKTKHDDIFLKQEDELLFSVEKGPFYAIIEHTASLGTLNGVNVNRNCQPVRKNGTAIKDVYVVGNNVNGLYSDGYPSYEGIANGFAFVSGWIAAKEARKSL